jgi:hypothetical protein
VILVRAQKTRMMIEMLTVQTVLMRLWMGVRAPLGTGVEAVYIVAKNLSVFCHETLWEAPSLEVMD